MSQTQRIRQRELPGAFIVFNCYLWLLLFLALLSCSSCQQNETSPPLKGEVLQSLPQDVPARIVKKQNIFREVAADWNVDFVNEPSGAASFRLPAITGSGCAIFDVDRDGLLDLFFVGMADASSGPGPHRLFRQTQKNYFEDVTVKYGLGGAEPGMGIAVGDANNDGWPDVYLSSHGKDSLWLNSEGQCFEDITEESGLGNVRWAGSATWCDYDRDGRLDLFVTNYVDYVERPCVRLGGGDQDFCSPKLFPGTTDLLFRNVTPQQGGTPQFENLSLKSRVATATGAGLEVLAADLTGDHWPDFYVANDQQANRLWVNQRDGTFIDEASLRGCDLGNAGQAQASMGLAMGDLNDDDLLDLMISHLVNEPHALYLAQAGGYFLEQSHQLQLASATVPYTGFGIVVEDFEHDGLLEVVTANGDVRRPEDAKTTHQFEWTQYAQRLLFLKQTPQVSFQEIEMMESPLAPAVGRGLATGDLDHDGDLDLIVNNLGSPSVVLENISEKSGEWLSVSLVDPAHGSRPAVGAHVTAHRLTGQQVKIFQPRSSYQSTHAEWLHFTSQSDDPIWSLDIIWPDGSLHVERFEVPEMNSHLVLQRGTGVEVLP